MKKIPHLAICSLVALLFIFLTAGGAAGKVAYEYGELVVVHKKTGELKSSTTVYFFYGDGKEIRAHESANDPSGLGSRRKAYRDFIESYTRAKHASKEPSIITVLNTLGSDGWEIIYFSDRQAESSKGPTPQSTYLFKRRK